MNAPIAITGIGCLLPGDTNDPATLWNHLRAGRDLITETPADRWNLETYYHPDPAAAGRTYLRWGGFLSDPSLFDAGFFGIGPREAHRMDPQQRWLLHTVWEALEDAGCTQQQVAGTNVGVYLGISYNEYHDLQKTNRFDLDAYTNSGSALSIASNRISYMLDLRGPSLSVDTACSSSLVALHLACRAMWQGEISMAIVGGANSLFVPETTIGFSKAHMLSPQGRCQSFDANADGYVRSEGAICLVLKPLEKAMAQGDRIYAAVRSTYVNQDGRTSGMTVPNVDQQAAMLTEAYRGAGVSPQSIGYVEAHGTGTPVGDPIEALALGRVLGAVHSAERPLWMGSIKSNLGHLEAASGVAGLAKLALMLQHRTIPPNLHFRQPNPGIAFDQWNLRVPTQCMTWQAAEGEELLYGGVSSYGFGGTNAHAVLSSAPEGAGHPSASLNDKPAAKGALWTVSARSKEALREAALRDAEFLEQLEPHAESTQSSVSPNGDGHSGEKPKIDKPSGVSANGDGHHGTCEHSFAECVAAAERRRSHHRLRLAVDGDDAATVAQRLRKWTESGAAQEGLFAGQADAMATAPVFVFTGQAAQWPGMGRDLYSQEPRFRAVVQQFDDIMFPRWGLSVVDVLKRGDESVYRAQSGQPLLFALQIGLARLLEAWGVQPSAVLGHSTGEISAAHICGALTAEDAAWVVMERSLAQEKTRDTGTMAAVGISLEEAEAILAPYQGSVHVAAINSPTQLTLAGDVDAIEAVTRELDARGKFTHILPLPYPYHTPRMDALREEFLRRVAGVRPQAARVPFISTVTGTPLAGEALDSDYWWQNLRAPVQFMAAVRQAIAKGPQLFLELGPHPALLRYVRETLDAAGAEGDALGTLRRQENGVQCLRETVAALHVRGATIDWETFAPAESRHCPVPRYPWQKQPFWAEPEHGRQIRISSPTHPLLGIRQPTPGWVWETDVSADVHPYLKDHGLDGQPVFPGAAFLEQLLSALAAAKSGTAMELNDVRVERLLCLDVPYLMQTSYDDRSRTITINARRADGGPWHLHSQAHGRVIERRSDIPLWAGIPDDLQPLTSASLYDRLQGGHHIFGSRFRTIAWAGTKDGEFWGRLAVDPEVRAEVDRYLCHPSLLDGAFQLAAITLPRDEDRDSVYLPIAIDRVNWQRAAGQEMVCHIHHINAYDVGMSCDIQLYTPQGELIASLQGYRTHKKPRHYFLEVTPVALYHETWVEAPAEIASAEERNWVILDVTGTAESLAETLQQSNGRVQYQPVTEHHLTGDDFAFHDAHLLLWAVRGEKPEPSTSAVFDTVWPVAQLIGKLGQQRPPLSLMLVTAGAVDGSDLAQAALAGMFRVVSTEFPQVVCKLLDLDPTDARRHVEQVRCELQGPRQEEEISYQGNTRLSRRLTQRPLDDLKRASLRGARRKGVSYGLRSFTPGSIDALAWVEPTAAPPLQAGEVEIEVAAVGLNFRDVLKALDLYPLEPGEARTFGDECSGVVRRVGPGVSAFRPGDAVMAIVPGCLGDLARVDEHLVAKKPERLSFAEAATIPIAFLTADYSLNYAARLQAGETVLIHAAAGGVGQAAVQIAHALGATVIGTASPEKHEVLRANGVTHIFNSRDLSFVPGVREATGGQGVDVVLNSLAGEFLPKSLELLKPLGRFVEIGKKDIFQNESLELHAFRTAVSFTAIDLARVIFERPAWIGERLKALLAQFEQGTYRPLPPTTFACQHVHDAFRLMAQGKHRGKVVLTFQPASPPQEVLAGDGPAVRPDATYLITGGFTGLGLATAQWLVSQGSKSLVLTGRREPSPETSARFDAWREQGVAVRAARGDVTSLPTLTALLQEIQATLPPLRGVFHSAMVLHDEPLVRLTPEALEQVLAPKVQGAWNLHLATRDVPLDHFVLYSSCATLLGAAGQASYVVANRFLDALAEYRCQRDLPALAINWAALADFGVVRDNKSLTQQFEKGGHALLGREAVFDWLKFLLRRDATIAGVMHIDWAKFAEANSKSHVVTRFASVLDDHQRKVASGSLRQQLVAAAPAERRELMRAWLRSTLARVLNADPNSLDDSTALVALGLDSLMAFEVKLAIDRELSMAMPITLLTPETRLGQLPDLMLTQLAEQCGGDVSPAATADTPAGPLTDADLERIIEAGLNELAQYREFVAAVEERYGVKAS